MRNSVEDRKGVALAVKARMISFKSFSSHLFIESRLRVVRTIAMKAIRIARKTATIKKNGK